MTERDELTGEVSVKNKDLGDVTAETVSIKKGAANKVEAGTVEVILGSVNQIDCETAVLRQAGAQSVKGETVTIRQGGAVQVTTDTLQATQAAILLNRCSAADLTAGQAGAVIADKATLDQAFANLVISKGETVLDQGGAGVLLASKVEARNSGTVILIAGKVEGEVHALFDRQAAVVFGAVFGLVMAVILRLTRRG
jgi:hypothetical protein